MNETFNVEQAQDYIRNYEAKAQSYVDSYEAKALNYVKKYETAVSLVGEGSFNDDIKAKYRTAKKIVAKSISSNVDNLLATMGDYTVDFAKETSFNDEAVAIYEKAKGVLTKAISTSNEREQVLKDNVLDINETVRLGKATFNDTTTVEYQKARDVVKAAYNRSNVNYLAKHNVANVNTELDNNTFDIMVVENNIKDIKEEIASLHKESNAIESISDTRSLTEEESKRYLEISARLHSRIVAVGNLKETYDRLVEEAHALEYAYATSNKNTSIRDIRKKIKDIDDMLSSENTLLKQYEEKGLLDEAKATENRIKELNSKRNVLVKEEESLNAMNVKDFGKYSAKEGVGVEPKIEVTPVVQDVKPQVVTVDTNNNTNNDTNNKDDNSNDLGNGNTPIQDTVVNLGEDSNLLNLSLGNNATGEAPVLDLDAEAPKKPSFIKKFGKKLGFGAAKKVLNGGLGAVTMAVLLMNPAVYTLISQIASKYFNTAATLGVGKGLIK